MEEIWDARKVAIPLSWTKENLHTLLETGMKSCYVNETSPGDGNHISHFIHLPTDDNCIFF